MIAHVEAVHCHFGPPVNQAFQRVDGSLQARLEHVHLFPCHRFQHIVRRILSGSRSADPDFDPDELLSTQGFDDRLDAVVSAVAASPFDPETSCFQIQVIMDEKEVVCGKPVLAEETLERRTRHIHEVEGAGKLDEFRAKPSRPPLSGPAPGETDSPSGGSPLQHPYAGIVAGLGVRGAGVAQPNDEAQRYFFFSASFFSAFGAAAVASFLSPTLASAAAGAAVLEASAASAPSTGTLPFAMTSGSFAPSGPAA